MGQEEKVETEEEKEKKRKRQEMFDMRCHPDMPNLSVGDVNLTEANFEKFKKENELFILAISDSQCLRCCFTEQFLDEIHTPQKTN